MLKHLFIIIILLHALTCTAQNVAVYNINNNNGLSSNHVYCTLVDKSGYLWLGTTDGLYRYNGYTFRKYDYTDGLPNIDVWALYEDMSGRIWISSIAADLGYIKNNVFKKLYKKTDTALTEVYPGPLIELKDKIIFSNGTTNLQYSHEIGIIKNDTLSALVLKHNPRYHKAKSPYSFSKEYVTKFQDSFLYLYNIKKLLNTPPGTIPVGRAVKCPINMHDALSVNNIIMNLGRYFVYCRFSGQQLNICDIHTGALSSIDLTQYTGNSEEVIVFCYLKKDRLFCLTNNHIIIMDNKLNIVSVETISAMYDNESLQGLSNTYFENHKLWGKILCTNNKGLFIACNSDAAFKKSDLDLSNYKYLGASGDTAGYWWNTDMRILLLANEHGTIFSVKPPLQHNIKKIISYNDTTTIILTRGISKFYYPLSNTVADMTEGLTNVIINKKENIRPGIRFTYLDFVADMAVSAANSLYVLGASLSGTYKCSWSDDRKTMHIDHFENLRYQFIEYNEKLKLLICYSFDKVLMINTSTKQRIFLGTTELESIGIKGIEKIMIADNGNVIIKDYNQLYVFNLSHAKLYSYYKNYNLKNTRPDLRDDILTLAGEFGVLQARISSQGNLRTKNVFPNTKSIFYKYIKDVQFSANYVLLNTDQGTYTVNTTNTVNNRLPDSFNVVLNYDSTLSVLQHMDTISISQKISILEIDVIRPTGTGPLNIKYSIEKRGGSNPGQQILLQGLLPGSYNNISLIFSDDSWISKPFEFTVYIKPYIWQTPLAKKIIIVLVILLSAGIIYVIVIITKKIVNNNNNRRNQRRELELKSIYSQINPHFIFNSLSTAQYFVKKNRTAEAYEHINQFSDLLRSYIKSSRDKYITIAEELQNLENYLQLQLTRFENKFEYKFEIDNSVNPSSIKIPSLLLQPLVENALNHGIFHNNKKGFLMISFKVNNHTNELICIVDDNGIGRRRSKQLRSEIIRKADSYGNILIKELIDTFNKYETIKINLEYFDKNMPETGTTVIIRIKNYNNIS